MLQKVAIFCGFISRNCRCGDLLMDNGLPPIQPFDQHRQLRAREPGGDTIPCPWPNELSALKPFCIKAKPRPVPHQGLQSITSFAPEQEDSAGERIKLQYVANLGR